MFSWPDCWKTYSTAIRAKSSVVESDKRDDEDEDDVLVSKLAWADEDGKSLGDPLAKTIPLLVTAAPATDVESARPTSTLVGEGVTSVTCSETERAESPLNMTNAFSEVHVSLDEANKPKRLVALSGMLKLVAESVKRRGIESPSVTLFILPTVVVVQDALDAWVHSEPAKPLTHKQLQLPSLPRMLMPPFLQSSDFWHIASAEAEALL